MESGNVERVVSRRENEGEVPGMTNEVVEEILEYIFTA